MDKLERKVLQNIRTENLIPAGTQVVCGFSGGADSVCLLSVLQSLTGLLHFKLSALHVNHGLRGKEARADEAFCREFCRQRDIPFQAAQVKVKQLVSQKGLSVEEAARILRYEALEKAAGPEGLIAVAHHADDQAETILLNLMRGTGLKGLSGMSAKRGRVIRPLLNLEKEEILDYLKQHALAYVTDSSNFSCEYTRNRVRSELLPLMKEMNPRAPEHILNAGKRASEAQQYLMQQANAWITEHGKVQEKEAVLERKKLKEQPPILRKYVIIETLRLLEIPLKDWGEAHLSEIDAALGAPKGTHLDLPGGSCSDNTYQEIIIRKGTKHG